MVSGDLLDALAAPDRLHGDSGLEFGTVDAALAHEWKPHFRGGAPPHRLTMGPVQKKQTCSDHANDSKNRSTNFNSFKRCVNN